MNWIEATPKMSVNRCATRMKLGPCLPYKTPFCKSTLSRVSINPYPNMLNPAPSTYDCH